jgi:hypothetical protein
MFVCPSACYTETYRSNLQAFPLFGNVSYSGVSLDLKICKKYFFLKILKNSLICKAALHDGRIAPWNADNSTIIIRNSSLQSTTFISALRNGIVSGELVGSFSYLVYQFASNRINGLNK